MPDRIGDWLRRVGVIEANRENAAKALRSGALVLVFPGGDYDSYRPTFENKIDFAGRTGYVRTAIESDVPIVPMVSIGAQESQLFLTRGNWLAKRLGLERLRAEILPITFGFPFGLSVFFPPNVPLPTKIVTQVLDPIDVLEEFGEDPDIDAVDAHVRQIMQTALDKLGEQAPVPDPRLADGLRRRHRGADGAEFAGKPCGTPYFGQAVDHCIGGFVDVIERLVVGQYRDVHLVDVTPDRHVECAARREYSDRVDLGDRCPADDVRVRADQGRWRQRRS